MAVTLAQAWPGSLFVSCLSLKGANVSIETIN